MFKNTSVIKQNYANSDITNYYNKIQPTTLKTQQEEFDLYMQSYDSRDHKSEEIEKQTIND